MEAETIFCRNKHIHIWAPEHMGIQKSAILSSKTEKRGGTANSIHGSYYFTCVSLCGQPRSGICQHLEKEGGGGGICRGVIIVKMYQHYLAFGAGGAAYCLCSLFIRVRMYLLPIYNILAVIAYKNKRMFVNRKFLPVACTSEILRIIYLSLRYGFFFFKKSSDPAVLLEKIILNSLGILSQLFFMSITHCLYVNCTYMHANTNICMSYILTFFPN